MKAINIKMKCHVCAEKITLRRQGDEIIGRLFINIPAVTCGDCVEDLLQAVPDPPGLLGVTQLGEEDAVGYINTGEFYRDLKSSVTFFCTLFENSSSIYDSAAVRLHSSGYPEEAFEILNKGLKNCTDKDVILLEKAALQGMADQPREGLETLEKIKDRSISRYFTVKGNLILKMGEWDEAAKCWEMAIESDPKDDIPWGNLGHYLLHVRKNYPEAERHYFKAAQVMPDIQGYRAYLADSLYFQGKLMEALENYRKAENLPIESDELLESITKMISVCEEESEL